MSNPFNIEVGQTVYRIYTNYRKESEIREYEVSAVKRKYFYLKGCSDTPIVLENLMYESKEYSQANFRVYLSKQEILDEYEYSALHSELSSLFSRFTSKTNFTLKQLRDAARILGLKSYKCPECGWQGTESQMGEVTTDNAWSRYCKNCSDLLMTESETFAQEVTD